MAFDAARLMAFPVPEGRQRLSARDCILYALSVGAASDPLDQRELRYAYEDGLIAMPTMANVLAHPGLWVRLPEAGIDWRKVVHGEQSLRLHRKLPTSGEIVGRTQIRAIADKGAGRGAFVYSQREVVDATTGAAICTLTQTNVCRGDGGCGSVGEPPPPVAPMPQREPDLVIDMPTAPHAALLYRLNGDLNPLHVDVHAARAAGFERPILHGLCSLGHAGTAILRRCPDADPATLRSMSVRFVSPVYPGETLRTQVWIGSHIRFRSLVVERSVVALDNGIVEFGDLPD